MVENTVTRINQRSERVSRRAIPVAANSNPSVNSIAVADGNVGRSTVSARFPRPGRLRGRYHAFHTPVPVPLLVRLPDTRGRSRAALDHSNHFSKLLEVDPRSGRVIAAVTLNGRPVAAAGSRGSIWCVTSLSAGAGLLVRVDPPTRTVVAHIPVHGTPTAVATGLGAVWVAVAERDLVYKIDERTNAVVRTVPTPGGPLGWPSVHGRVWVLTGTPTALLGVDPTSGAILTRTALDGTPHALAVDHRRVWVALS